MLEPGPQCRELDRPDEQAGFHPLPEARPVALAVEGAHARVESRVRDRISGHGGEKQVHSRH